MPLYCFESTNSKQQRVTALINPEIIICLLIIISSHLSPVNLGFRQKRQKLLFLTEAFVSTRCFGYKPL